MFLLQKLVRLPYIQMMIKECNQIIRQKHMYMERAKIQYVKKKKKKLHEAKYKFLINKRESAGLKHFNDSEAFSKYSNSMDDIYQNIGEYNPNKKCKILIVFDDMIADMLSNTKT